MMIVVYAVFVVHILVLTERVEVSGVNDGSVSTAVEVPGAVESGILVLNDPVENGTLALDGPVEIGAVALDGPVESEAVPVEGSL